MNAFDLNRDMFPSFPSKEFTCKYCNKVYSDIVNSGCTAFCHNRIGEMQRVINMLHGSGCEIDLAQYAGSLQTLKQSQEWKTLTAYSRFYRIHKKFKETEKMRKMFKFENFLSQLKEIENEKAIA